MSAAGPSAGSSRPDAVTLIAFAAVVLMAGANVVAVRFSNRELDLFWGAALRFLLADGLLFALVLLWRLTLPRGRALMGAVLYGLLGFGMFFAFAYWGLLRLPAGIASVLLASVPLMTFFFALLHRVETFRWQGLAGATIAIAGIAVMFVGPSGSAMPLASMLAMLAAAACAAEASVLIKLFPSSHPITTNAVGLGAGALFLVPVSLIAKETWALPTLPSVQVAVVYLVVFGSFALFIVYLFALKRWTASDMSYQFVLTPLVAVALSAWLEAEPLTWGLALGARWWWLASTLGPS